MAKIDPLSPFYLTLWLKKGILQQENLQEVRKNEPLGGKYLLLCVSKQCKCLHQGGLATAFDLAAFRLSMIAPVKKSVNHPRTVASMLVTGWE